MHVGNYAKKINCTYENFMYMYIYTRAVLHVYYILLTHVGGQMPVTRKVFKFNKYQISILEKLFAVSRYVNRSTSKKVALQTGLKEEQVYHWFIRKRWKEKMELCKETF